MNPSLSFSLANCAKIGVPVKEHLLMQSAVNFSENIKQQQPPRMEKDPPFYETYKSLIDKARSRLMKEDDWIVEECELPLIDLRRLRNRDVKEREKCKEEISRASMEWGFFQVVNHGISNEVLEEMRKEQVKVFHQPFDYKCKEDKHFNFSRGSYRWGTPSATCLSQLSWSEAFHIPFSDLSTTSHHAFDDFSSTFIMEKFGTRVANLAQELAGILAEKLGCSSNYFKENCLPTTSYLRMNRYPPCPFPSNVFGLMPHTDSDFLTILHQDQVGGLHLVKDGKWIAVKPNPDALIINIGDLFQAWSNNVYKSVEHRVVTNPGVERFSTAYFLCPSYDTVIGTSCVQPSVYKKFSFGEYRQQVQQDAKRLGRKVGLTRFLL